MFDFFKKKEIIISSPVKGKAVLLSQVNDSTFADELLGKGFAVIPEEGKFYAPCDGVIEMVFDTLHAVSMTTKGGAELLVHIGLDTVELQGKHFKASVVAGDKVKKGDLLITVELEDVKAAGYDVITPVVVCNTPDYETVKILSEGKVNAGDEVLALIK